MTIRIPQEDLERIEQEVAAYRRKLEWLYEMAYIAGQIKQAEDDRAKLKAEQAA